MNGREKIMARDGIDKHSGIRRGISLSFGSFESGLWFDSDKQEQEGRIEEYVRDHIKYTFGLKLSILWGKCLRPIPKFYKLGFWKGDIKYNPWRGGEYWFILRIPFVISPFISIALGNLGAYIGCKYIGVDPSHTGPERYGKWLKPGEASEDDRQPNMYLCPAFSIRMSRLI